MTSTVVSASGPAQRARDFMNLAIDHGWAASYEPGIDTGGARYVTVTAARRGGEAVRATWHTRNTGTYRLTSCIAKGGTRGWYDLPLTAARSLVTAASALGNDAN